MGAFDNFINNLSDHELAIFVGYRYRGFLKVSQEKLDSQIKTRNLSSEQLKAYSKIKIQTATKVITCPRCGSDKLFQETDYKERPVTEFSSVELAIDTQRCRLCGYNQDKQSSKSILEKVKKLFRFDKNRRIVKWNEI